MASANVILDAVKRDPDATLKAIIAKWKDNADMRELAELAETELPRQEQKEEEIRLQMPAHTLASWKEELARTGAVPTPNVHFKEEKGCLFMNDRADSWTVDETDSGYREQDLHPNAAPEMRREHFDNGVRAARTANNLARQRPQNWTPLAREDENDVRMEDSQIRYLTGKKEVDWHRTVKNLANFGARKGYTEQHFKSAFDRFVSFFNPSLRPTTENMTAEKIARFLSSLTAPDSKYDIAEQQIKSLVRPAGQKIKTIMAHLKALAETLYDKVTDAERTVLTDRLLTTGILNMTTGQTRTDIKAAIEYAKRENCTLDWDKMIEAVSRSESVLGMPQTTLPFSGAIQPSILTFNVDTRTPGMYHNGVDPLIRQDLDMSWPQTDNATRDWYNPHLNAPPPHMHNGPVNPLAQNALNPAAAGAVAQQANNPFEGLMQPANAALNAPAPQRNRAASLGLEENFMRQAQQVSGLRSGSQRNHPDHAPNQVNHVDIVDVLVANIQNGAKELAYQAIRKELERKRDRNSSRDRDNKDKNSQRNSRTRTNSVDSRDNSRDRTYRANSGNRPSRDNRSDSRDRTYRDTRYNSRDRDVRDNRSNSRDSRSNRDNYNSNRNNSRDNSYDRNARNRSNDRRDNRDSSRGRDRDRMTGPSRDTSRDRRSNSWSDGQIQKGFNCSSDYDPLKTKRCMKCLTEGSHHEFNCQKYQMRSRFNCKVCKGGFHWPSECQDIETNTGQENC